MIGIGTIDRNQALRKAQIPVRTRGGVNVIFEVRELPIIRDLQFKGAKIIQESDILKEFREKRVGISKESVYDPVKAKNATRILREMLASKGYPNSGGAHWLPHRVRVHSSTLPTMSWQPKELAPSG